VLQSQVSFDDGRTTAHPVFVALCRLMNVHFSTAFTRSSNHGRLTHLAPGLFGGVVMHDAWDISIVDKTGTILLWYDMQVFYLTNNQLRNTLAPLS
jgi:hypothetical protein